MADDATRIEQLEAENAALRAELQASNRQVSEALEQQTATAEVLRVIASSPTNLEHVLATLVASVKRLSESAGAAVWIREGDQMRSVARAGGTLGSSDVGTAQPLSNRSPAVRALVERRLIHLPDRSAPAVLREFPDLPPGAVVTSVRFRSFGSIRLSA